MKPILVLFTGGTIGSTVRDGAIDTDEQTRFKLLTLFKQRHTGQTPVVFETRQPLNLLSENLHPTAWPVLIAALEAEDLSRYAGIIVTHGTDTLAFTAAALALYGHQWPLPVLLVSSDRPLDDPAANGLDNFSCAVAFIRQNRRHGVFVPYRNAGQAMQVHVGTRLAASLQLSGDFISVQSRPYLSFTDDRFVELQPLAERLPYPHMLTADFSRRILLVRPYPGLDYSTLMLNGVDAVLHDLYHSGTACATEQWGARHALPDFVARCRQQNVPLFMAPALGREQAYRSTHDLLACGARMIWNQSLESAYVKLLLGCGNFAEPDRLDAFLAADLAWEHVDNPQP